MSGWESDDDLLNEEAGAVSAIGAFKDDDLDEDALLGDAGFTEDTVLEGDEDVSNLQQTEGDTEEYVQQNEEYETQNEEYEVPNEEETVQEEYTEEEQEELDYEDTENPDDMIELQVAEDDEFDLGIAPEEEADFSEANVNSSEVHVQESQVSSTGDSGHVSEPVQSQTMPEQEHVEAEEAQEEEESDKEDENKKEEEEEDDNEEEEESERGRFKSERKDTEISKIRIVSSTANRKVIPDNLELSTEQQAEISKFEEDNRNKRNHQRGRGGRRGMRGHQRGGFMGQGLGQRPPWSGGTFPQQMRQPVPQPQKILINPHFKGTIQAQPNMLLRDMQIPGGGVRFGMNSGQQNPPPLLAPSIQLQRQQQQQQHFQQRPAVSWSGPGQPLMQQPLHNQQSFQQQQRLPNMVNQVRPPMNMSLHHQGQPMHQQGPTRLMQPGLIQNNFPGTPQHGNQIGNQGNRMVFGQQIAQPRVHWEGNLPNQGPSLLGTPMHVGGHMTSRQPFRFGEPVRHPVRHQEPTGQPIQTVVGSQIQTVVGGQRRQQQPPLRPPGPALNQHMQQQPHQQQPRQQLHGNRPKQLSPNQNQMLQQSQRRSVKDRLGPRPAPVAAQQQQLGSPGQGPLKRRSTEPISPSPTKAAKTQGALVDDSEYQRRMEEQKKVREKIKAMKEKKRLEAAESRRQELIKRLAEEGKSVDEILEEPAAKKQHLQPQQLQGGTSLPPQQKVYINQQGNQVVKIARAEYNDLQRRGLVKQGQMKRGLLRAVGMPNQRLPFLNPGQAINRFTGPGPEQQGQMQVRPGVNRPFLGRGAGVQLAGGRGGVGPSGPGRGLMTGLGADVSPAPGLGRGRSTSLQRVGSAPATMGRGVQRKLRQVNTSASIQLGQAQASAQKPVNRQVLRPGASTKAANNGSVKTLVNTVGRGKIVQEAVFKSQSVASRLGPPPGVGRGRGATMPGAGSQQTAKPPVGRITRNMVNLGRGVSIATKIKREMSAYCFGDYERHFDVVPDVIWVGGSGDGTPGPGGGQATVHITGIPAGGMKEVSKYVRATSNNVVHFDVDPLNNAASVTFPSMGLAKKFQQQNDRRMINMGLIHVNIV